MTEPPPGAIVWQGQKRSDFDELWFVYTTYFRGRPYLDKSVMKPHHTAREPASKAARGIYYFDNYWNARAYYLKLMEQFNANNN